MAAAHLFVDDLDQPVPAPGDLHHLSRVLRLRPGERVTVSDGAGSWRACRFEAADGPAGALVPDGQPAFEPAPAPVVTLAVALPKGERGEWAVQKLTELGVDRIVVLASARSELRWVRTRAGGAAGAMARLGRIARQAAMQARLIRLPELWGPLTVAELVEGAGPVSPGQLCAAELGARQAPQLGRPAVMVGPEGGWADGELPGDLERVGLGPTVLRTETAAVAAASLLCLHRPFPP